MFSVKIKSAVYAVSLINVYILDAGYCLQCYSCVNPTDQLYSPAQCNTSQVNSTCVAPNDTCLDVRARFSNYTGDEVETELQLKACATNEDCKRIGNEKCGETGGRCTYTCCQHDLCNNDNPSSSLYALRCYHCEGPDGSTSHIFNHSTPLNMSYTAGQCHDDRTKIYCPSEYKCAKLFRVFRPDEYSLFEVERSSCISNAEVYALQNVCNRTEHRKGNRTSWCSLVTCDIDFCNLASCVSFSPFFIAFLTMLGMISMRWERQVVPTKKVGTKFSGYWSLNLFARLSDQSVLHRATKVLWIHSISDLGFFCCQLPYLFDEQINKLCTSTFFL